MVICGIYTNQWNQLSCCVKFISYNKEITIGYPFSIGVDYIEMTHNQKISFNFDEFTRLSTINITIEDKQQIKIFIENLLIGCEKFTHPKIYLDLLKFNDDNEQILNYFKQIDNYKFDKLTDQIVNLEKQNLALIDTIENNNLLSKLKSDTDTELIVKLDSKSNDLKQSIDEITKIYEDKLLVVKQLNIDKLNQIRLINDNIVNELKEKNSLLQQEFIKKYIMVTKLNIKINDITELYEKIKLMV